MFKSHSQAQINEAQRKHWGEAKAQGKTRFIWRETMGSLLIWLIVSPVVQVFGNHGQLFSLQFVVICLATLPIFTLGGYLTGNWKWKELGKKYPE
jgi:Tfp pilus assembly protein PilN